MEEDYQENYHKAREIVAKELSEKYGFVESYRDYYRLTLDSESHSFHLIFEAPEGKALNVTKKGERPNSRTSFLAYVFNFTGKNVEKVDVLLQEIYKKMKGKSDSELFTESSMITSYKCQLDFLEFNFSYLFS